MLRIEDCELSADRTDDVEAVSRVDEHDGEGDCEMRFVLLIL